MLAILNSRAAAGRSLAKWRPIESDLAQAAGPFLLFEPKDRLDLEKAIVAALHSGERRFLALGGDGTVNAVVAALMAGQAGPDRVVGAVGLGSSNDFHKPYRRLIGGLPCRIAFDEARPADVGTVAWTDPEGRRRSSFWVVNASIGTTAAANWSFNHPDPLLGFLKRTSTGSAITYAAAGALLTHPPERLSLNLDGVVMAAGRFRNLGIVKNPHFTGSLRYDSPDEPDSGRFFVHGLGDVPRLRMMQVLAGLARGRFTGAPGTWSSSGRRLTARSGGPPFSLEFDGEVVQAVEATFTLLPSRLRFCP